MARFIPKMPRRLPHVHIPFFRIFYSTTYTFLYILTLIMLAVNPSVMIYTAFDRGAYQYVFEIGGVYILTAILALFIYLSRLYTNRTVMAAVGKSWIPVEEGEVGKKVRKMIVRALERSAIIALESRPRDLSDQISTTSSTSTAITNEKVDSHPYIGRILQIDPQHPPWGQIKHPGWSTPSQNETNLPPHVQFRTVIHELPNLVEARAVSLAPPDPYATPTQAQEGNTVRADPIIVELLRRKPNADMRTYLGHLSQLGLINPPEVGEDFLWQYDRARFSGNPLSESQFEHLMASFALLLSGMQELSKTIIGEARANRLARDGSETTSISSSSISSSYGSDSIAGSVRRATLRPSVRTPSLYRSITGASYDTAPTTAIRERTPDAVSDHMENTDRKHSLQTADTLPSTLTPTLRKEPSRETFGSVGSVLRIRPTLSHGESTSSGSSISSLKSRSLRSYAGSVIRHSSKRGGNFDETSPPG